jgi:hypothetical protein
MKIDKAIFIIQGQIPENMQYELSKKIDEIAKSFGLESYLDDVCEHNNTITSECSDCNEQELYDLLLRPVLNSIVDTYVGGCNNNLTDLIYDVHEGEADLTDELVEKIEADILRRLSL